MDQVKEILRQAIKYRFWIALGISLLVPAIAYVVGSGPVKDEAVKQTTAITNAKKDVEQYANGNVYNGQYRPIIEAKTAELGTDVYRSWKKLYARQAPLLTWPERVQERFTTWGRKWPEEEDASRVQFAIIDYVQAYGKYVTDVYNSFRPFDYVDGGGVVVAPDEKTLLRPAPFKENEPPDLGKVWAAQERLWIQRSLLEVINEVNKNAKGWDTAHIKAIKSLEVGSAAAQDQVSMANGDALEEAAAITDPKAPPPAETSAAPAGMEGMMAGMMGSSGGMGEKADVVYYLANPDAAAPYKTMPVELAVLIEQDRIQDFLTALENSPMSIQVKEFALSKPTERVTKPERGQNQGMYGYMGYSDMMGAALGRGRQVGGFGGNMMMRGMAEMGGGYGPAMGGAGSKGVDKRSVDRRKKGEEGKSEEPKAKRPSAHDQYFNVVEVTVYGQVRFYNPPPPEPPAEPTTAGDGTAPVAGTEEEKKAEGEMPAAEAGKEGEAKKAEGDAPAEKDKDAAKKDETETPAKDEAKKDEGDAPKKDEAAKDEPAAAKEKAPEAKAEEPAKEKESPAPKPDGAAPKDSGAEATKK